MVVLPRIHRAIQCVEKVPMTFLLTLKALYAANGVIGVALYIPQILRAKRDKKQALALSMVTFGGWTLGALVTTLYAWYFVHDLLFACLSFANVVAAGSLFLLILHTRWLFDVSSG
jgi:zinc transporter ZupT